MSNPCRLHRGSHRKRCVAHTKSTRIAFSSMAYTDQLEARSTIKESLCGIEASATSVQLPATCPPYTEVATKSATTRLWDSLSDEQKEGLHDMFFDQICVGCFDLVGAAEELQEGQEVEEFWLHPADRGVEPLLCRGTQQCVLRPTGGVFHQDIWDFNERQISTFWSADEVQLDGDAKEIKQALELAKAGGQHDKVLTPKQLEIVYAFLAFFASSDVIVAANNNRLQMIVKNTEFRETMGTFRFIEGIHSDVYSRLVVELVPQGRKQSIEDAVYSTQTVRQMAVWAQKWMNSRHYTLAEQIMAFVVVEGVFFSGPFCVFFWLKKQGHLLTGACKVNEFIAADEAGHAQFGAHLLTNHIVNRPSTERAHEIVSEGTKLAVALVLEAIPVPDLGINATSMSEYVHYVADYWLTEMKYPKMYNAKQPFDFIKSTCDFNRNQKSNFFEDTNNRAYRSAAGSDVHINNCSFTGDDVDF